MAPSGDRVRSGMNGKTGISETVLWGMVLVLWVGFLGLHTLWDLMGRDQGIFATIGVGMGDGQLPYRDLYDNKPPLTFVLNWLTFQVFASDDFAIRKMDYLITIASALALARLVVVMGGGIRLGVLAGASFAGFYYALELWFRAQTDGWAAAALVFGTLALAQAWHRESLFHYGMAGVWFGVAFLFKYTVAPFGLLVFLPLLWRGAGRLSLAGFVTFAGTGLATLGICVLAMMALGIWPAFVDIQLYLFGYAGLEGPATRTLVKNALQTLGVAPFNLGLLVLGSIGGCYLFFRAQMRPLLWLAGVWFVLGLGAGIVQQKGWPYHFLPLLPGAAILAAMAPELVLRMLDRWRPGRLALGGVVVVMLAVQPASWASFNVIRLGIAQGFEMVPPNVLAANSFDHQDLADARDVLVELVPEDETFFLWGWEASLYQQTGRRAQHRFIHIWPFAVSYRDGRYTAELMQRLQTDPPLAFVVQHSDATMPATGEPRDSRQLLEAYPELQEFLAQGYALERQINRFDIYLRRKM